MHLPVWLTLYSLGILFIGGACMGSFLNCVAWRIIHHEPVFCGRSHCEICGHSLGFLDLVPIVGFLSNRGRCRYCGGKLSVGHVLAELSTGLVYLAVGLRYGVSFQMLWQLLFVSILLACAFADLHGFIIPDVFLLLGVVVRLAWLLWQKASGMLWLDSFLGALVVGGGLLAVVCLYEALRHTEAMGGGDLKMLIVTGLYFGLAGNLLCLFLSCVFGIFFGLVFTRGKAEAPFPWGPGIAAGAIVTALFGSAILEVYTSWFFL